MSKKMELLVLENASVKWRNFKGREDKYSKKFTRDFAVFFDEETAVELLNIGWDIRQTKPSINSDPNTVFIPEYYMKVTVDYNQNFTPKIVLISGDHKEILSPDTVGVLDSVNIDNIDLIIYPYQYEVGANSGVKAKLNSAYITIRTNALEAKYGF